MREVSCPTGWTTMTNIGARLFTWQDLERCQTGGFAGAAGNEGRICDQLEGGETDRTDTFARTAGKGESGGQIILV